MEIKIKQISEMEKIRTASECMAAAEKNSALLLRGEHMAYQTAVLTERTIPVKVKIESDIAECVKAFVVCGAAMDFPIYQDCRDEDYITREAGLMPDILVPLEKQHGQMRASGLDILWIDIDNTYGVACGEHYVKVTVEGANPLDDAAAVESVMNINVIDTALPKQKTLFTQWFYADCIATAHNVEIYSEEHWSLIEKYIKTAAELGINMILTPVITPPLDTGVGELRPDVQLLKIDKNGDKYSFDFSGVKRWIELCKKYGIEHFEISHLFSQWGLEYSPNIYVFENGEKKHMFGWHVKAESKEYREFLGQLLPELMKFLEGMGVAENCYFHISDEPSLDHIENYRSAYELVKPLLGNAKTMDALSNIEFYNHGLVPTPVTAIDHIEPFLEQKIENQWAYYCCGQTTEVGNRFLAMPAYRNRILGLQMYLYNIEGFLQWGYNFYFSQLSVYEINPYMTTSSDKAFPSGDPFSVYPSKDGVYPSMRAYIFKDALQDVEICRALEKRIGREKVEQLIKNEAGMKITFKKYPRNSEFVPQLMNKMRKMIAEFDAKK